MDHTEEIKEAVCSLGLGSVLQIIGREPFEVTLRRDGERSWWYCDTYATDAHTPRPRDNSPYKEFSIHGGTYLIVYRLSAEIDAETAASRSTGAVITAVIARRYYAPEKLVAVLASMQP